MANNRYSSVFDFDELLAILCGVINDLDTDDNTGHDDGGTVELPDELVALLFGLPWRELELEQLVALADCLYPCRLQICDLFPCLQEFWYGESWDGMPTEFYAQFHARLAQQPCIVPAVKTALTDVISSDAFQVLAAADTVTDYARVGVWSDSGGYHIPPPMVRIVATPRLEMRPNDSGDVALLCASFEWENSMPEPNAVTGIFVVEYGHDPKNRKVVYRVVQEKLHRGRELDFQFELPPLELPRIKAYYLYVAPPDVTVESLLIHPGQV